MADEWADADEEPAEPAEFLEGMTEKVTKVCHEAAATEKLRREHTKESSVGVYHRIKSVIRKHRNAFKILSDLHKRPWPRTM